MPKRRKEKVETEGDILSFRIKEKARISGPRVKFGITRAASRKIAESILIAAGLGFLIFTFIIAHNSVRRILELGNVTATISLVVLGAILTFLGLRGASHEVRMGGGSALAGVGLILLVSAFLTTYGLMGALPRPENLFWLSIMMAVGVFSAKTGIPRIRELDDLPKKTWGSIFAAFGLGALAFSAFVVHTLVGVPPMLENLLWLAIMVSLSGFLMRQGFPLIVRRKNSVREAWEWVLIGAGLGILARLGALVYDVQRGVLGSINLIWALILVAMCLFLLGYGIKLKRE